MAIAFPRSSPSTTGRSSEGPISLEEMLVKAADIAHYKVHMLRTRPGAFLLHAIAGGVMVAFGATLALAVSTGIGSPGLANLVMGAVFGFSLVIIMVSGMSLITADMALGIIGVFHQRFALRTYLAFVAVGYVGNAIGSFFFMFMVSLAKGPYALTPFLLRAHAIAAAKTGMPDLSIFLLGILCTWFLQTAMFLYLKARSEGAKMILAYYGPLAFVAGMTEHAIANIGFIALPILMQGTFTHVTHVPLTATGLTAHLSWGFARYGWAHDQLFTLMGNFVGGVLFGATAFQLMADPQRIGLLYRMTATQRRFR
ncbi:MAG: nitrite transporter [Sulfobacillus thermosulfidooxidans]|nr:MAG: nitrite transporter [Sulfobacillus thermosulfidooxidans]